MSNFEREIDVRRSNRTAGGGADGIAGNPDQRPPTRCPDHLERYRISHRGERNRG